MITLLLAAITAVVVLLVSSKNKVDDINVEKNYGVAHFNTEISADGVLTKKPEDAVPTQEDLLKTLKDKGYEITSYHTVFDTDISSARIYAKKEERFIDICYGLTEENATEAFNEFDSKYKEYYLMAMNGNYVYCISDKKTFQEAGFKSLANIGIQYIYD